MHFSAAWEGHVLSAAQDKDVLSDLGSVWPFRLVAPPFGTNNVIEGIPH